MLFTLNSSIFNFNLQPENFLLSFLLLPFFSLLDEEHSRPIFVSAWFSVRDEQADIVSAKLLHSFNCSPWNYSLIALLKQYFKLRSYYRSFSHEIFGTNSFHSKQEKELKLSEPGLYFFYITTFWTCVFFIKLTFDC